MSLITLDVYEHRDFLCEDWGDNYYDSTLGHHCNKEEGTIQIEWKYGDIKNGHCCLKWRIPGTRKFWVMSYDIPSAFSSWWFSQFEDSDSDEE